ncbi:MAG: hypothetical protein LAT83_14435 [Kiritimatiellae bacterium]|nr:hypothetical protein [Kiritimatiellia bacterium]
MNIGHLSEFAGVNSVYRKGSLERLIPWVPNVGVALRNQAKVNEGQKAYAVRRKFAARTKARAQIFQAHLNPNEGPTTSIGEDKLLSFRDECKEVLEQIGSESVLPTHTLSLVSEMMRVGREEDAQGKNLAFFREFCREFVAVSKSKLATLLKNHKLSMDQVYTVLSLVHLDIGFDMNGKSEMAIPLVITPLSYDLKKPEPSENSASPEKPETDEQLKPSLQVLGHYFNAFAGFMSIEVSTHDFEVGRMMATKRVNKFTGKSFVSPGAPNPNQLGVLTAAMQNDIEKGRDLLANRIVAMLKGVKALPWFRQVGAVTFKGLIGREFKKTSPFENKRLVELRVPVTWNRGYRIHAGRWDWRRRSIYLTNHNNDQNAFPFHIVTVCQEIRLDDATTGGKAVQSWGGVGVADDNQGWHLILRRDNEEPSTIMIPMPTDAQVNNLSHYVAPVFVWNWKTGNMSNVKAGEWEIHESHQQPTLAGSFSEV